MTQVRHQAQDGILSHLVIDAIRLAGLNRGDHLLASELDLEKERLGWGCLEVEWVRMA